MVKKHSSIGSFRHSTSYLEKLFERLDTKVFRNTHILSAQGSEHLKGMGKPKCKFGETIRISK